MKTSIRNIPAKLGLLFGALVLISGVAAAQIFPAFASPADVQSSVPFVNYGVSAVQAPNGLYSTALLATYTIQDNLLGYSVMPDGLTPAYSGGAGSGLPNIDCDAPTPSTCAATVTVFNGVIYIAYADASTRGLDIVTATPVSGNVGYQFQLVQQFNSVQLTTSPGVAVFNNQLIYIYGTSSVSGINNAFFETTFDGTNWTQPSDANLGANNPNLRIASASQPALAVLNGTLHMCTQQNNSSHNLFLYYSPDGVTWYPSVGQYGEDSSLQVGGGATMVAIGNTLVLANQQNNSNHALFIFSSTDGVNWTAQEYSGIKVGATPAIALFNGDVSLAFQTNNATTLSTDIAAQ
ncbi:hypothetical protein GOB94_08005 [Granulicella sp. 5B5]|uniref:hypothetical protein n=1 Tax=Granulicella sp. 5B5 TaxID=1617967 RepID=UPI0015F50105|nr:hypothetical protein [Granulicella sp. 5B5]QMV18633.1 hypothetical protein GOB94_08005 [Granulicella sp. 5B5]